MIIKNIFKHSRFIAVSLALSSMVLTSCATSGGPKTAVQSAMGKCVISVGGGAILGAVIGNNTGSGNAKSGALKGAIAGAGVCGFLLYRASEEDKSRIAELELAALNDPKIGSTKKQFTSTNGKDVFVVETITTKVSAEEYPAYDPVRVSETRSYADLKPVNPVFTENDSSVESEPKIFEVESEWDTCRALNTNIESGGQVMQGQKRYACRTKLGDWVNF